ncbi:MAG TPA: hypothetical protein PKK12_02630 [Candidatus Aminicenantes bacterium]|nr:hypothetical protein [Candidatus Aminicenantes bacterium]
MNPDLISALERLRSDRVLPEATVARLLRMARGQLVSLHAELRLALYAGVLLVVTGVGLLLKENLTRIGPLAIAGGIAVVVAVLTVWVVRHVPPFSWAEARADHLAFDYLLLLAVLLGAADLAYVEWQFTPLGAHWPTHLLLVSLAMAAIALRCDSRLVFSLALSTFAAWRGVSISRFGPVLGDSLRTASALRLETLGCGLLFLALGVLARRLKRKAHFEPVAAHLGWIAILLALLSGTGTRSGEELLFTLALIGDGVVLALLEARRPRFSLVALGMVASYVGVCLLFLRTGAGETAVAAWYAVTSLALLVLLFWLHRRLRERT